MAIQYEYKNRIVCLIDILGFSQLIHDSVKHENKPQSFEKLNHIYTVFKDHNNDVLSHPLEGYQATQFSDSIILSIPYNQTDGLINFLHKLQDLIIQLSSHGILCRGSITIGDFQHQDNILFGPALVDAYLLEDKVANYPRVIIDPRIMTIIKGCDDEIKTDIKQHLDYDSDGFFYITYVNVGSKFPNEDAFFNYLNTLKKMIEKELENSNITIRCKFNWLGLRYNHFIHEYKTNTRSLTKLEDLLIQKIHEDSCSEA